MTGIYELTLRTPDGRERRELAYLPNEAVKQDLLARAKRNGLAASLVPLKMKDRIVKFISHR